MKSVNKNEQYDTGYPTEPTQDKNNPYWQCVYCKRTDPEINGNIKNHSPWCTYRQSKELTNSIKKD